MTVIVASFCEVIVKTEVKETRFKRESEVDCQSRGPNNAKVPLSVASKPLLVRQIKPVAKPLNTIPIILPRRKIIPAVNMKPTAINNTSGAIKNDLPNIDDNKTNGTDNLNNIIKPNNRIPINCPPAPKTVKDDIEKETTATETELDLTDKKTEQDWTKNIIVDNKSKVPDYIEDQSIGLQTKKEIDLMSIKDKCQFNTTTVPDKVLQNEKESQIEIDHNVEFKENKIVIDSTDKTGLRKNSGITKVASLSNGISPNLTMPPSTLNPKKMYTSYSKKPISEPKEKSNTLKAVENDDDVFGLGNTDTVNLSPTLDSSVVGNVEEVFINNNNYEELYESAAPAEYFSPQLISSEYRPAHNWNNFKSVNENYDTTKYDTKDPNAYSVTKNGNQYIAWDNGFNNNNNRWAQGYKYVQSQHYYRNWGSISNVQRYTPTRIWRSWNNNKISLRPRAPVPYRDNAKEANVWNESTRVPVIRRYEYKNMVPVLRNPI